MKPPPLHLSTALQQVTAPFLAKLGCHYFQYLKVYRDGSFSYVTTLPEWDEYITELLHKTNMPAVYSHINGDMLEKNKFTFLWDPNLPETPVKLARDFNIANGFTLVERYQDFYYMFAFATPATHTRAIDTYFNSLNEMNEFLLKFKYHQHKLIKEIDHFRINVPKIRQDCNLDKMLLEKAPHHLSAQELACIKGLSHGHSYKEIAKQLGISHRTVETYLNRVRERYHLRHKHELISLL